MRAAAASLEMRPSSGRPGDQAGDRLIAEPRHAVDDFCPSRERRVGFDLGGDGGVELAQLGPHRLGDRAERLGDDGRRAMLALLSEPPFQIFQGGPRLDQPVDLLARRIGRLGLAIGERLGEPGDRLGVDRVVLGQPPGRLGKATNLFRIDDKDLEAGAAALPPSSAHNRRSPPSPPGRPGARATTPPTRPGLPACSTPTGAAPPSECRHRLCSLQHRGRQFASSLAAPPLPSLLVRALTPMQLFGLRKTPDLSLASPQVSAVVATGSGPRRAVAWTTARSPSFPQFADTRWRGAPDGVWPAASNEVGLHNRHREPVSSVPAFRTPSGPSVSSG